MITLMMTKSETERDDNELIGILHRPGTNKQSKLHSCAFCSFGHTYNDSKKVLLPYFALAHVIHNIRLGAMFKYKVCIKRFYWCIRACKWVDYLGFFFDCSDSVAEVQFNPWPQQLHVGVHARDIFNATSQAPRNQADQLKPI